MLSIPTEIKRLAATLAFHMSRGDDAELIDPMLNAVRAFLDVPVADCLPTDDDDPVRRARHELASERFDTLARILNPISPRYETAELIIALGTEYLTRGDRAIALGKIDDRVVFDVEVITVLTTKATTDNVALLIEWQALGQGARVIKSGRTKIAIDEMATPTVAMFLDACRNEIILREFHGIGVDAPDDLVDQAIDAFEQTNGNGFEARP